MNIVLYHVKAHSVAAREREVLLLRPAVFACKEVSVTKVV